MVFTHSLSTYLAFGCRSVWLQFIGVRQWRGQHGKNHKDERDDALHVLFNCSWLAPGQTCFPQHFTPKLIFEQQRRLYFITSRQLVSSKQELHSNADLECVKDWLLWAVRDRSDAMLSNSFPVKIGQNGFHLSLQKKVPLEKFIERYFWLSVITGVRSFKKRSIRAQADFFWLRVSSSNTPKRWIFSCLFFSCWKKFLYPAFFRHTMPMLTAPDES